MNTIWFKDDHVSTMIDHALAEMPQEACGLLLGEWPCVTEVIPAKNVALNPHTQYVVDPVLVSRHLSQIMGFYHSHPESRALPSQTDMQEAWQGDTVYVIIGFQKERYQLTAWKMNRSEVQSVEIHVGDEPPVQTHALTQAQKAVIILSGAVALLLFLIIAVSLLPPAPPIP